MLGLWDLLESQNLTLYLRALISLETAVWCSALHTINNMETGLSTTNCECNHDMYAL